ncbi:MAG: hypothetical protein J0L63_07940 [Anaerolineae bacterium]|nr:hypothetical protein [Anaerolineae bacterium]
MSEYAAFVGIDIAAASASVVVKLGGQPMGTILPFSRIIQSEPSNSPHVPSAPHFCPQTIF